MAWYLLKVTICSGMLYTYYLLALKNKTFHRWNRVFLLTAAVLSLAAPLIRIDITQPSGEQKAPAARLVEVVTGGDDFFAAYAVKEQQSPVDALTLLAGIYLCVSLFMSGLLTLALLKIYRLQRNTEATLVEGVTVIHTNAKGTPFSFLNNIFWNPAIDVSTPAGKRIFQHELVHVLEKHTYDKLFINTLLIIFWFNPFLWLIRRELSMVHEFIADKRAVEDNDTAAFAEMILVASYPQHLFNITNSFTHSPLKRRLIMLAKNKNSRISYLSRFLVLPFAALVFIAFTLRMKTTGPAHVYAGKKLTVVIDAGHGGEDKGGMSESGIYEKDLTLGIAKKVRELNKNENLNVILLRAEDETIGVKQRTEKTKILKADLYISIHIDVNTSPDDNKGFQVLVPNNGNAYLQKSRLLGSAVNESFKSNGQFAVSGELRQSRNIWVLKENCCPAVLVQVGFINKQKDLDYLTDADNQQTIANNILNGIEKFADGK